MLAATIEDVSKLRFPLLASPKLDGIRCVIRGGRALSRSLKPIPNKVIRAHLESLDIEGLDGELMLPQPATFQDITSAVMSPNDTPPDDWYFAVFDDTSQSERMFAKRLGSASCRAASLYDPHVELVDHRYPANTDHLAEFEELCLAQGFEGVMLRCPDAPYKFGRSTLREHGLMKLKRFKDDEALIADVVELQHNLNPAETNELGRTKRSTAKAGKVAGGTLGALVVVHPTFGAFELGSGFDDATRTKLWNAHKRDKLIGQLAKFKYFPIGVKDKPRHPVFLGLRHADDM